jgi:hypothetical protein
MVILTHLKRQGGAKIEACCASDDANQCPGRYMGGKKGGSKTQIPYLLPTTKFFEFR